MVAYRSEVGSLTLGMLDGGFFDGWPTRPDAEEHLRILRQSDFVEVALDGGQVVGFATAISDGSLSAYIPLLEVVLAHRGQGIGTELIRRLLARLSDLYMVDVCCDDDLVPFYERFGLTRFTALGRRNYAAQAGGFGLRTRADIDIADAGTDVAQICAEILAELPTWFGMPEANAAYAAASVTNETLVAYDVDRAVGLLTLTERGRASAEVHLMAVRPELHRRGIGRTLLFEAERQLRGRGFRYLQVKTLSPRHPEAGYALTRSFYSSQGFVELEEFAELWGADNPALQMVKAL